MARSAALFDWIESEACGEEGQMQVLQHLQMWGVDLPTDADGDVELAPENLDAATLWKLDAFCQQQSGGQYAPDLAGL
jgi:hypothetical protein